MRSVFLSICLRYVLIFVFLFIPSPFLFILCFFLYLSTLILTFPILGLVIFIRLILIVFSVLHYLPPLFIDLLFTRFLAPNSLSVLSLFPFIYICYHSLALILSISFSLPINATFCFRLPILLFPFTSFWRVSSHSISTHNPQRHSVSTAAILTSQITTDEWRLRWPAWWKLR